MPRVAIQRGESACLWRARVCLSVARACFPRFTTLAVSPRCRLASQGMQGAAHRRTVLLRAAFGTEDDCSADADVDAMWYRDTRKKKSSAFRVANESTVRTVEAFLDATRRHRQIQAISSTNTNVLAVGTFLFALRCARNARVPRQGWRAWAPLPLPHP